MSINASSGDRIKITPNYSGTLPGDVEVYYEVVETLVAPANEVTPGSNGFSGATARSAVDGGASYTTAGDATAVTRWGLAPFQVTGSAYGDSLEISVVADHYNGIDKVGFIANGGTEVFVSASTTGSDGIEEYKTTVNTSSMSAGDTIEVRAIAYPNHGVPRILQGDIEVNADVDESRKMGLFGLKVTKISGIQVIDLAAGETLGSAFQNIQDDPSQAEQQSTVQYHIKVYGNEDQGGNFSVEAFKVKSDNSAIESMWQKHRPHVPILVEGMEDDRAIVVQNSAATVNFDPQGQGWFNQGAYHFKNFTWDASTVNIRPSASSGRATYHYFEDCHMTDFNEIISDGEEYTDVDNVTNEFTNNGSSDKTGSVAVWTRATRIGCPNVQVSFAGDETYGIYVEDCDLGVQLSTACMWIRNCISTDCINDVSHYCFLNLDIVNAGLGYEKIYPIVHGVSRWWERDTDYPPGTWIIVDVDGEWKSYENNTNGDINSGNSWDDTDWDDSVWPHIDGNQNRDNINSTQHVVYNTWLEGLTADDSCSMQPYFNRSTERWDGMVWKRWEITNQTEVQLTYMSQIIHHCHHWLMDDCVWTADCTSGNLRIVWTDNQGDKGWGQDDDESDSFESVGCRNAKWTNSEVRLFVLDGFPTSPSTMSEFSTFINGQTDWDIDIDAYTQANSTFE